MDTPDPTPPTLPPAPVGGRRRTALLGALLGMSALAATVVGVGAIAGAQEGGTPDGTTPEEPQPEWEEGDGEPEPEWEAFEACLDEQLAGLDDPLVDSAFVLAEDECLPLLPEAERAELEAWRPYDDCLDEQLGDLDEPWFADEGELDEEALEDEWAAFDEAWAAADEACADLLPEELRAEMEAFEAFEACLDEAGLFELEEPFGSELWVETGEGLQVVQFGTVEGSVTISGTADDLSVTTSGGVALLDEAELDAQWAEIDALHETCEQHLPHDLDDTEAELDEADLDDTEAELDD